MTLYGYARVSVREPEDKNLDLQVERLVRTGCPLGNIRAEEASVSRASTKHTSGAEQKCTTREVIGQRKCPRQLFGRSVTEAGWQQAGVSE